VFQGLKRKRVDFATKKFEEIRKEKEILIEEERKLEKNFNTYNK